MNMELSIFLMILSCLRNLVTIVLRKLTFKTLKYIDDYYLFLYSNADKKEFTSLFETQIVFHFGEEQKQKLVYL